MSALLAMSVAVAAAPVPAARPGLRVAGIGAAVGAAGAVTAGVGFGWAVRNARIPVVQFDDAAPSAFTRTPLVVGYAGLGVAAAGAPVVALGALSARRSLGARDVAWWPGAVAIGAGALAVPAAFGPGGLATSGVLAAGAWTLATVQWSSVRRTAVVVAPGPHGLTVGGVW